MLAALFVVLFAAMLIGTILLSDPAAVSRRQRRGIALGATGIAFGVIALLLQAPIGAALFLIAVGAIVVILAWRDVLPPSRGEP
jgi:hypothetical protein